ncbi:hypothetical protein [Roseateles violae]|uniref:Uncharacterized protein n=1 Tax=Roseateles violae TaxID=3058042 RepID=A0ABT8E090_9BURK|nr:hypothetical protein [Pelomonas sp. PFR6]MDN3923218.1 hypothetical protein [Pelomonas sp. PFR6]
MLKRWMRVLVLACAAVLQAGCAIDRSPPPENDLVALGRYFGEHLQATGDEPRLVDYDVIRGGRMRGKYKEEAGYRTASAWWCRDDKGGDPWLYVKRAYSEICQRRGGVYDDGFCSARDEHDRVLFMAKVTRFNDMCQQVEVLVAEPTTAVATPAYTAFLRDRGFKNASQLAAASAAKEAAAQSARQRADDARGAEQSRLAREWPMMQRRGTTVCRTANGIRYVAYVEDATADKLKLLVSRAYLVRATSLSPGDFRQEVIWSDPINWSLCAEK